MMLNDYDTLWLDEELTEVKYIDQTKLPTQTTIKSVCRLDDMYKAILDLEVRGAPAIGVFAALSMYVLSTRISANNLSDYVSEYEKCAKRLCAARPTAVNLSWAINHMTAALDNYIDDRFKQKSAEAITLDDTLRADIVHVIHDKALRIYNDDIDICKRIGENGLSLIEDGDRILTHCNAGRLATVRYGTATAPIYMAHDKGYDISVYCDETRPLLQGARLTAYELSESGINTTLLCDNMAASLIKSGKIDKVYVGCDRVAKCGDTANKIGTLSLAIIAKHYGVPFYVCAPTSSIDLSIASGDDIVIENRDGKEVTDMWYQSPMAPHDIDVYNPAFDVTDSHLISAIITENGIAKGDYSRELEKLVIGG